MACMYQISRYPKIVSFSPDSILYNLLCQLIVFSYACLSATQLLCHLLCISWKYLLMLFLRAVWWVGHKWGVNVILVVVNSGHSIIVLWGVKQPNSALWAADIMDARKEYNLVFFWQFICFYSNLTLASIEPWGAHQWEHLKTWAVNLCTSVLHA